jgi:hypothetical protein
MSTAIASMKLLNFMVTFPPGSVGRLGGAGPYLLPILPRLKDSTSLKLACRQIGIGSNLAGSQFGRVGFLEHESTRLPTPNEGSRIAGVSLCGT